MSDNPVPLQTGASVTAPQKPLRMRVTDAEEETFTSLQRAADLLHALSRERILALPPLVREFDDLVKTVAALGLGAAERARMDNALRARASALLSTLEAIRAGRCTLIP